MSKPSAPHTAQLLSTSCPHEHEPELLHVGLRVQAQS